MILQTILTGISLLMQSGIVYAQKPANDDCVNATVIPSNTTLPFQSDLVDLKLATTSFNYPSSNCIDRNFSNIKDIWYVWKPNTTDKYLFTIKDFGEVFFKEIAIFRGINCTSLVEIACDIGRRALVNATLQAEETYYVNVGVAISSNISLNVETLPPPPLNAVCSNASSVQVGETVTGDLTFSIFDVQINEPPKCGSYFFGYPTLWYKITNTSPSRVVFKASTCNDQTVTDTVISVFDGRNGCANLECIGGVDDTPCGSSARFAFAAAPSITYYVAVQSYDTFGNFSISFETEKEYFAVIDATSDEVIAVLQGIDLDYSQITSSNLNIEAVFDESVVATQSVLVKWNAEDPRCERKSPYSVFKDTDGDFFDATIQPGSNFLSATSFAEPDCQGASGVTLEESIEVIQCGFTLLFKRVSQNFTLAEIPGGSSLGGAVTSLPCDDVNIEAVFSCGFDIKNVRLKLRKLALFSIAKSRTELVAPYYLFGNKGDSVNTGTINSGFYDISISVNGITFPTTELFVSNNCYN